MGAKGNHSGKCATCHAEDGVGNAVGPAEMHLAKPTGEICSTFIYNF